MHIIETFQNSIEKLLINLGLIAEEGSFISHIVLLLIFMLIAFLLDRICRRVFLRLFKRFAKRTKNTWDDLIVDRKIPDRLIVIIPAFFMLYMVPVAFPKTEFPATADFLGRLCLILVIAVIAHFLVSVLSVSHEIYNRKQANRTRSLKGFVQVLQIVILCIAIVWIIAILVNQSPGKLFAGLGASAAILSLVFKDLLVGFVAGIQLTANDMLRPGDWIEMPKYGADGTVLEVTLNAVKVRNFDNTYVTIPPNALISDSFKNWRGMDESGGRRIKRAIYIDMKSVHFCTDEMLQKFRKISLITDYVDGKEKELHEYNESHHIDASVVVNGRRQTNIGVFRAYLEAYLKNHPMVNTDLTTMVRQLQPTDKGIPLELYLFSREKRWVPYEAIQADIFDHILAVIPQFGLEVYQSLSGSDLKTQL